MPAEQLIINKSARKKLHRLPLNVHKQIVRALTRIEENPILGSKLHGELKDFYKLRVGDYRIVYTFESETKIVTIVKIEHRQGVYR